MKEILGELNNRDIALLTWLTISLVALIAYRSTRQSLGSVLKAVFFTKVGTSLLVLVAYVGLIVFVGLKLGLWHTWMLKDTLFWLFGSAIILLFGITKVTTEKHYFREIVLENLKFAVVLDFVLNLYVFSLWVELLLAPTLAILAMLVVVAGTKDEYAPAKKLLNWILAVVGLGIFAYAVASLLGDVRDFATLKNLEDFLVPIVLTFILLPCLYVMALYLTYELMFVRLRIQLREDESLLRFAQGQVVRVCLLRLSSVKRFTGGYVNRVGGAATRNEIERLVAEFQAAE